MQLFEPVILSKTEDDIVKGLLANPAMIKYLRGLAQVAASDYAMTIVLPKEGQTVDLVASAIKGAFTQGMIFFAQELLQKAEPPEVVK